MPPSEISVQCGHVHPGEALNPVQPNLGVAKLILSVVDVQGAQQLLCGLPAVHKGVIWDGTGVQDSVPGRSRRSCNGQTGYRPLTMGSQEW